MNNKIKKYFPTLVYIKRCFENYLRKHNPAMLFSLNYRRIYGRSLNYHNPVSFYDKVGYMAFFTDTSLWTKLADKVGVRDYVEQKGLTNILCKQYGTYKKAEDINYDLLPNSFVLKTNNGSATNIIVRDKSKIDVKSVNTQLNYWIKMDYGYMTCQPHYSKIHPLILAEELLVDSSNSENKMLIDYKFYCVNGIPRYVQVMTDRVPNTHLMKVMVYDMKWNEHPEFVSRIHEHAPITNAPSSFSEMKEYARILSEGLPFVRVDFYEIKQKPIFGEMTFTPGFDTMTQAFFDMLGRDLQL